MNKDDFLEIVVPMMEHIHELEDKIRKLKTRISILEASE